MRRLWLLVRRHGQDALIVLMTIATVFELALKRGTSLAAQLTLWFAVPAIVIMVLPLFVRRRFPFAAPAAHWLLPLWLSFVDGRVIGGGNHRRKASTAQRAAAAANVERIADKAY